MEGPTVVLHFSLPRKIAALLFSLQERLPSNMPDIFAGILVGTLGVAGFLQAAERIRGLAQAAGKKTYTILMGKPSPAKLANFPEVEVFVLVADPQVTPLLPLITNCLRNAELMHATMQSPLRFKGFFGS